MTKTPIPVMGVLIVNGVHWLRRMIDSVDYPVRELCIINNNGRGKIDYELDELVKEINYRSIHSFIEKAHVVHMPANVGVACGWNLIIKSYLMENYWFIVSHDVEFSPNLIEEMVNKNADPKIGMTHIAISDRGLGSFEAFMIKDWVVQKYGLFDENMYPAYAEDVEYLMRTNGTWWAWGSLPYRHGDKTYNETGSQTIRQEPDLFPKLEMSRWLNETEYLPKLYGPEWWTKSNWTYSGPTQYDLEFCRRKYIGF